MTGTRHSSQIANVTVDDLRSGRRARISQCELIVLDGLSRYTHERDRSKGRSRLPFQKDDRGRIWYEATDVLAYLAGAKHRSTNEYDTTEHIERLEIARAILAASRTRAASSTDSGSKTAEG